MLRKYHSAITPAVREQQMVGFVLMSMVCCSPAYIPVCIMRGYNNQSVIAAS
jgi:hypothetical protein